MNTTLVVAMKMTDLLVYIKINAVLAITLNAKARKGKGG